MRTRQTSDLQEPESRAGKRATTIDGTRNAPALAMQSRLRGCPSRRERGTRNFDFEGASTASRSHASCNSSLRATWSLHSIRTRRIRTLGEHFAAAVSREPHSVPRGGESGHAEGHWGVSIMCSFRLRGADVVKAAHANLCTENLGRGYE